MPLPDIYLYTRPGCHLCDEARDVLLAILARRSGAGLPSPALIERNIGTNDAWQRAFHATIPVVEIADRRIDLATSPARLRRFVDDALGAIPA